MFSTPKQNPFVSSVKYRGSSLSIISVVVATMLSACASTKDHNGGPGSKDAKDKTAYPTLNKPEVHMIWVPDKIEGEQFIQGHFICLIDKNSTWRKE